MLTGPHPLVLNDVPKFVKYRELTLAGLWWGGPEDSAPGGSEGAVKTLVDCPDEQTVMAMGCSKKGTES